MQQIYTRANTSDAASFETPPQAWRRQPDGTWVCDASPRVQWGRRAIEVLVAATVLVMIAPVMLVIAFLVRRDSPGPALFLNKRVGLDGRPFHLVKFRTHYVDARERFPDLSSYAYDAAEVGNVRIQFDDDPRVTRVGRWLRSTSLDELPNFWNVLVGDMTFVGPRPELWEMFQYYEPRDLVKFTVRPGITGLAQTSGRGFLTVAETNALDLEYVRNRSLMLDVKILLKTVVQVLCRDGAL